MFTKGKELYLAILLGLVLPSLVFAYIGNNRTLSSESETVPTQTVILETEAFEEQTVRVKLSDGTVADMELEKYITGVVLQEMPVDFEIEALKAQAVVARTYTCRRQQSSPKHSDADICTDSNCCQGYCAEADVQKKGFTEEQLEKVTKAVEDTRGQVLFYNGELIEATYFSCSGGMTEDAKAVWGSDVPYLQATKSPGEEQAAHYSDTVRFSVDDFQAILGEEFSGAPESWFRDVVYTEGGGVESIRIAGKLYTGIQLRTALDLRSTAFVMTAVGNTVTVTTKGFGHRVGMSQYGAEAMAVAGSDYLQILSHYYVGTELAEGV